MAASAALVFAGKSLATPAISFLVRKAFDYLNEYRKAEGMDDMKNRILLAVPKIQAVFDVVNPEHIKGESSALDAWLWQLRDAVEKAEDAVDEVEYYELEEKAKDRKVSDWGASFAKMRHRAVNSVKHASFVDKAIKGLTRMLFAPLRTGKSGSKILLTTRMQSVADLADDAMMGQNKCLPLKGLKEDENIKLFNHIAFPSASFQDENLRPIGEQIATNLKGCPLVTKVVASDLKGKQFQDWKNFLHQKLENFEGSSDDITVMHSIPVQEIKKIIHLKNLRSIIIINNNIFGTVSKDVFNALEDLVERSRSLRLFQSYLWHTSYFLGKLGKLKHLRFVLLLPKPPSGIVKLYHLTTLQFWHDVERKHKQLRDIGNLHHLRNVPYGSDGFGYFPVGRLQSLLALKDYRIQGVKGCTISALKDVGSLRILSVKGLENVGNQEEAKEANLKEKRHMKSLFLEWSQCNDARSMIDDELILDSLEPHANLMGLYISGFSGTRTPQWIARSSVKNLSRLEFRKCENLKQLPILGILTLRHLLLVDLPRLNKIGQALNASGDECLKFLPPCLLTFDVRRCSELVQLPLLPPSLVFLHVDEVGLTKLPRIGKLQNGNTENVSARLQVIHVVDCQSLTSLEGSLFEQRQYMGAVSELHIISCAQLESEPIPFEVMYGLRKFCIEQCPMLRLVRGAEDKLLPSSLWTLKISQCGDLELLLLGSLQGLTNLFSLVLENCSTVESLPSSDVFKSLKSLWGVKLLGCGSLSSLGGLGSIQSIGSLEIFNCPKLTEGGLAQTCDVSGGEEENLVVPTTSLRIERLSIDLPSLLLVEPLNSLCHIQDLWIQDGAEMESLAERWLLQNRSSLRWLKILRAQSLESLPPSMRDFSSLKFLALEQAEKLQSLPDLPSSLELLVISGCSSEFEKKFGEYGSPERNLISHIRAVEIGDSYFFMGKKCSKETHNRLRNADDNTLSSWLSKPEDNGKGNMWNKMCCLRSA
ncbi:hypothetical protein ACP4OV_003086 [Aristida adscensionis]